MKRMTPHEQKFSSKIFWDFDFLNIFALQLASLKYVYYNATGNNITTGTTECIVAVFEAGRGFEQLWKHWKTQNLKKFWMK